MVGWRTNHFPAFYTQNSGLEVPHRVDDAISAARVHVARRELGQGGVLLAVPIPSHAELDGQRIADAIEEGLNLVSSRRLSGPQITPVVLAEVEKVTGGDSVKANLALAEHNADIAAQVALAIAQL